MSLFRDRSPSPDDESPDQEYIDLTGAQPGPAAGDEIPTQPAGERGPFAENGATAPPPTHDVWERIEALVPDTITPDMIVSSAPDLNGQPTGTRYRTLTMVRTGDGRLLRHGSGSAGVVFQARLLDGTGVACKVFGFGSTPQDRLREWAQARREQGEHIVRGLALYEVAVGAGERLNMMVMQLVEGPTLDALMKRPDFVATPELQRRVVRHVFSGLQDLRPGSTMRDLKPANIALTSDDLATATVVLLDHSAARDSSMTTDGLRLTTRPYAAPEVLFGAWSDRSADAFSAAASLLDVFTGGDGFPSRADDWEGSYLRTCLESPQLDHPALDERVARVLAGALVKRPADRPSVDVLLRALTDPTLSSHDWDPFTPVNSKQEVEASSRDYRGAPQPQTEPAMPVEGEPDPNADTTADTTASQPELRRTAEAAPTGTAFPDPLAAPDLTPAPARNSLPIRFAGVDPRRVHRHSERVTYSAAGVMLGAYALYAVAAVVALTHIVTRGGPLAWAVGAGVGSLVAAIAISLDRVIISNVPVDLDDLDNPAGDQRPVGTTSKRAMVLRVAIALLFAIVVSEPANLMLFGKDVEAAISARVDRDLQPVLADIDRRHLAADADQQAIVDAARAKQQQLTAEPDRLNALAAAEEKGQGATGVGGCGPQCRSYLAQEQAARNALSVTLGAQQALIDAATKEQEALRTARDQAYAAAREKFEADDGFFAQEGEFYGMLGDNPLLFLRYVLITLLMLVFEMAGIVTKFITRGNAYEREVARSLRQDERSNVRRGGVADLQDQLVVSAVEKKSQWRYLGNLELDFRRDEAYYAQVDVILPRPPDADALPARTGR